MKTTHSAHLESFKRNVCIKDYKQLEEEDYHSLAIGYFLGLGLDIKTSIELAVEARYTYEYWLDLKF